MSGLAWVVAVTLGLTAGGFMLHFPGSYGEPGMSVMAGVFGFLLGSFNGVVVGGLAALALRLGRARGTRLAGTTALVVGATHALHDGASTQVPLIGVQALAGLAAAGAFAWRFGERRPSVLVVIGATWTLGILVAGWSGDRLGLPLTETGLGWAQDHAWDGLVTGLAWGTSTAAVGLPASLRAWRRPAKPAPAVDEPA